MCLPIFAGLGAAMGASAASAAAVGTMAVASLAATAASAGLSFAGQHQAASQAAAQATQADKLNKEQLQLQYRTMAVRQREEQVAYAQQVEEISKQADQAFATVRVESGESGIYGNTVQSLLSEFRRQEGQSLSNLRLNYDFRQRQLGLEALGLQGGADANSARFAPQTQFPSVFGPILQVGAGALSTWSAYGSPVQQPSSGSSSGGYSGPTSSYGGPPRFRDITRFSY